MLTSVFRQLILTKGDNNPVDDAMLYLEGQEYIYRKQIAGFVRGYVPLVGWPLLLMHNPTRAVELYNRFV
jgi:signal peptidase